MGSLIDSKKKTSEFIWRIYLWTRNGELEQIVKITMNLDIQYVLFVDFK